ncbi:Probable RNA-binding protein EIF1AD [Geodia barretti]|uniref:Probable RNA-binding protein EIF1AD n=1 Tax=Geodia barretti TaxID=519541 RepID=A0AA35SN79_GEOBA|nr:Probable RNA-binding protein EIF1AD [Geodia barretti]
MSKATKRKHVTRQVVEEFVEPQGSQKIVKVLCGRGNNLHQVEEAEGQQFLASMPTKFRKNVWIKRAFLLFHPYRRPPQFDGSSRDTRRDNSW